MSALVQSAVFAAPLTPAAKMVLLALDHLVGEDGFTRPRKVVLARMSGLNRRTVSVIVAQLQAQGILAIEPGKTGERYRLHVDALRALPTQASPGICAG